MNAQKKLFSLLEMQNRMSLIVLPNRSTFSPPTTTNPQRLDNKSVIYPHLSHHIINTLSHQKDAELQTFTYGKMMTFFTIKELVRDSK